MLLRGVMHLSGPDIFGIMWWLNSLELKCFRTNSNIHCNEMRSYDSIITAVIAAACDTSHMQGSLCVLDYLHIHNSTLLTVQTSSQVIYSAANDESAALLPLSISTWTETCFSGSETHSALRS